MHRIAYPVMNQGPTRLGTTAAAWSAAFESIQIVSDNPDQMLPEEALNPDLAAGVALDPAPEETYSSSITRPACACKILNGKRMGQGGCATPTEGFPGQPVADSGNDNGNGDGPSTAGVIGGLGVLGVLGLIVGGVI